ncbi:MAG: Beta-galactosidase [Herbinix sp.]|jgi:beta-galactosidase|nr:Beta-galactosidase [Herbinix sp.]
MTKFTENGIEINGLEKPLYSGSIHYWRVQREDWNKILDEIKGMGFEIIETYIPWSVHEYEEGKYDFGEIDKNKDLDGFLSLCEVKGLSVIVRPGPHINAEMTLFGYPEWILHDETIQAKNPWGTTVVYPYVTKQFPIPSYASEKLYVKTEQYFHKITPILKKHTKENGCIITIQADNETCNFFRDKPYIMDYSIASIKLYHQMLQEKYETIENLNDAYDQYYQNFESVLAPTGFKGKKKEDLPYYFDWVEYKEYQILYALKKMIAIIQKMELDVPIFHNCAYQEYTPISVQRDEELEGMSVAGIDAYPEPKDSSMLRERIRYMAGSSRLPYVPEFGSGSWFDRNCLLTAKEEEYGYLYSIMNGLKAVNFYMLVERDRWTGCPITNDGRIRKDFYEMFQNMIKILKGAKIYKYKRQPKILILKNYDMGRLKALFSVMDNNMLSSNCFITGPDIPAELFIPDTDLQLFMDQDPNGYASEEWVQAITTSLDLHHYEYNYSDKYLSEEKREEYDVIFAATYDFMDEEEQKRLVNFANHKGKKLILGPKIPYLSRNFRDCSILKNAIEQDVDHKFTLLKDANLLDYASLDLQNEYTYENSEVEISIHWQSTGRSHLLFMANRSNQTQTLQLYYTGKRSFLNIWKGQGYEKDNSLETEITPYTVSLWRVEMEGEAYDKQ